MVHFLIGAVEFDPTGVGVVPDEAEDVAGGEGDVAVEEEGGGVGEGDGVDGVGAEEDEELAVFGAGGDAGEGDGAGGAGYAVAGGGGSEGGAGGKGRSSWRVTNMDVVGAVDVVDGVGAVEEVNELLGDFGAPAGFVGLGDEARLVEEGLGDGHEGPLG